MCFPAEEEEEEEEEEGSEYSEYSESRGAGSTAASQRPRRSRHEDRDEGEEDGDEEEEDGDEDEFEEEGYLVLENSIVRESFEPDSEKTGPSTRPNRVLVCVERTLNPMGQARVKLSLQ